VCGNGVFFFHCIFLFPAVKFSVGAFYSMFKGGKVSSCWNRDFNMVSKQARTLKGKLISSRFETPVLRVS
jgi:hypothetical protein